DFILSPSCTAVRFRPSPLVKTLAPKGAFCFLSGDEASKLLCLRAESKAGACSYAAARRGREYLDFL
ncbi:MAG: hypothetical protein WDZ61_00515, partial [Parcubacteria group bacterium]